MTLRFASLGSGSRGNALLIESDATLLMVDCGLPRRTIEKRLKLLGREPRDVTAMLISHEHGDHSQGIGPFLRRYPVPTWLTPGTAAALTALRQGHSLNCHKVLNIGSISVEPFPVPHDAREPCQFVFSAGKCRLGLLTDTGHVTSHIRERLSGCDALAIEANHDLKSLRQCSYPESVKARVASRFGHLNNEQTAALLGAVKHDGLQWVMSLHLSERTNTSQQVRECLEPALDSVDCPLYLATQDAPTEWLTID